MIEGLRVVHSNLPYLFLPIILIALVAFWIKSFGKADFSAGDKRLALITLILSHIQLLLGLALYFLGPIGIKYFSIEGFMKDPILRLYAVEHILTMILGITLITIGYSRAKRLGESSKKFRTLAIFYSLGLVLILSRIPWDAWLA